jgi:hypothetical protein
MATQDHIHLSKILGGAPENAPDTEWYVKADGWKPTPTVVQSHRRTLSGKLKKHRLKDSGGNVIRFMDYRYIVRVSDYGGLTKDQRLAQILAMNGEVVYLTPHTHVSDGVDHTSDTKTMYCTVSDIENLDPLLQVLFIVITLVDDNTV